MVMVGNKQDCPPDTQEVSQQMASHFAATKNCIFLETSAKSNFNVQETFLQLLMKVFSIEQVVEDEEAVRQGQMAWWRSSSKSSSKRLIRKCSKGIVGRSSSDVGNNNSKNVCVIS